MLNLCVKIRQLIYFDRRSSSFVVHLTEQTMETSERFSPIFQALAFGTDNKATTIDMMVAVVE